MKIPFFTLLLFTTTILSAQWVQEGADMDGEAANDRSGFAIDMPDTNTIAIGAYSNDGNGNDAGHVRIYRWNGNAWVQKGIDIDGEAADDDSGYSVSMPDSNTVAIGARNNDGNGMDAGHVRVYSWNGSSWVQKGADIDGETADDEFGFSVCMSDSNNLVVGSHSNDDGGINSGSVRVYRWNGTSWVQKGADIDGESAQDRFGASVSMPDSNVIAAGAYRNGGSGFQSGHARVFNWNGSAWVQKGLDIDGDSAGDQSGISISMPDVNTIGIGAYAASNNGNFSGLANVYRWNGTAWIKKGNQINGEAAQDQSGYNVSMPDSNHIAIGAPNNAGNGQTSGHVRIFKWNGAAWIQKGMDIDGESSLDQSGFGLAMVDTNVLAIGAPNNSGRAQYAGHARVFKYQLSTSLQSIQDEKESKIKIYPNPANDVFFFKTCEAGDILRISDMHGRIVYETMINREIKKIDVSNWSEGVYFLRYDKFTEKVVVGR